MTDNQIPASERIGPFTPLGEGADMVTSVHDALKPHEPGIARWMVYLVMAEAIRQRHLQRVVRHPSGNERPDYSRGPEQFEEARDGE